jgi:carbamoyltransferase
MAYAGLSNNEVKINDIDFFMDKVKNTNWNDWDEKVKIEKYIYNFLDNQSQYFDKYDLAYTMQKVWLESVIRDIAKYRHGQRNLVISGGCALNCMLNYLLIKTGWFEHIYFTPIASDVGQSYGAVLNYLLQNNPKELQFINNRNYSATEGYRDKEYFATISNKFSDINVKTIADKLADGKIIGICRGNIEMGPRALGNRTILASPFDAKMKDVLNELKGREWYRPYGILVPREEMGKYFDIDVDAPYMNVLAYCKDEKLLLGAHHKDKTVRVQTVDKKDNPWLHNLLLSFKQKTGVPILINTSFNDSGMPIFNYVKDMYRMYQEKLDGLVIGEKMILKE